MADDADILSVPSRPRSRRNRQRDCPAGWLLQQSQPVQLRGGVVTGGSAMPPSGYGRGHIDRMPQPGIHLSPGQHASGRVGAVPYPHELSGANQRVQLSRRDTRGPPGRERADVHLTQSVSKITRSHN